MPQNPAEKFNGRDLVLGPVLAAGCRVVFLAVLAASGQLPMALVNALGAAAYLAAAVCALRGRTVPALYLVLAELIGYAGISVFLLGDGALFGLYSFAAIPLAFLADRAGDPPRVRAGWWAALAWAAVQALAVFHAPAAPLESAVAFFRLANALLCLAWMLLAASILFRTAVNGRDAEEPESPAPEEESVSKGALLDHLCRELQPSVSTVCSMADLLLEEDLPPQDREYAAAIKASGEELLSLLADALDYSRLESGEPAIIPGEYDFAPLLHDVLETVEAGLRDRPVRLMTAVQDDIPRTLLGDAGRIREILLDILENAAKFTDEGTILLRATGEQLGEGYLRLTVNVIDTGVRDRRSAKQPEVLHTAKRLAECMGGGLTVESEPGRGSSATFTVLQEVIDNVPCEYNTIREQAALGQE